MRRLWAYKLNALYTGAFWGHMQTVVWPCLKVCSGPEVIKLFLCSTQLSMKFFLLINVKMPTIVGILTFMHRKNSILGLSEPEKCWISWYFHTYEQLKFYAQLSWAWKKFYNLGPRFSKDHSIGLSEIKKQKTKNKKKQNKKKKQTVEEMGRHFPSPVQLGQLKIGQCGKGLLRSHLWCPNDLARLWNRVE